MATNPNIARLQQQMRQAQQQLQRAAREADAHNRRVVAAVNDYNRKVTAENNRRINAVNRHNQEVSRYNRAVETQNRNTINALNRARQPINYRPDEQSLVDRVRASSEALAYTPETDVFLSYAKIDGETFAGSLRDRLAALGVDTWFATVSLEPGLSMARQLDQGLAKARAGVVVLTPAYIAGRFWTERELGALLHKAKVIPIAHGVTFEQVAEYSGILTDLFGFSTELDDVDTIAAKVAGTVKPASAA